MFSAFLQKIRTYVKWDSLSFFFVLSLVLWAYFFRGFLTEQLALVSDAIPYHGHFKFFIDNLARGVYPLWDPTWNCGIPNEFFLRRIGEFNPFYWLIIIYQKMGLAYNQAYVAFLTTYFFIAISGFYWLARTLFKDRAIAFLACILLLFSSLGTRLFASYIILIFVPIIWFAFFLVSFTQNPRGYKLFGLTLCVMVIVTTYIPFYFLTAFLSFLLIFCLVYLRQLKSILARYLRFFLSHKTITLLCVAALGLSLIPGYKLYKEGAKRNFVLPVRHSNSPTSNVLGVNKNRTEPSIFAHLKVDKLIMRLDEVQLNIFYLPFFVYLLFFLGAGVRVNQRIILFMLWIFTVFLIASPEAVSVHEFLFKRVFFFKYFRNLRFFLWVAILPAVILLVAEFARIVLRDQLPAPAKRKSFFVFIVLAHIAVLALLLSLEAVVVSTYYTLWFSFLFFSLYAVKGTMPRWLLSLFLLGVVVAQPAEVFWHLADNSKKAGPSYKDPATTPLRYHRKSYLDFSFTRGYPVSETSREKGPVKHRPSELYIATARYNQLTRHATPGALRGYLNHKFILYDQVVPSEGLSKDSRRLLKFIRADENKVIFAPDFPSPPKALATEDNAAPQKITKATPRFQVLDYDVNSIKLKTDYPTDKFLVYTDNYYPDWEAYVNGEQVPLYKANVSFKGIFLPGGENEVFFRYGSAGDYVLKYSIMLVFHLVFWALVFGWIKDQRQDTRVSEARHDV